MNGFVKIFLCFAIITVAQCMTPEQREMLLAIHSQCATQTGISDDVALKALEGEFPEDAKFKEHTFCISKTLGFQNEAGEMQLDTIKETLKKAITDEGMFNTLISKCAIKKGSPEESAYEMAKCMYAVKHS